MQLSEAGTSVPFCGQRRNSKKPLWFAVICALTLAHWGKWLRLIHSNTPLPLKCHKHRVLLWHHQDYLTLLIGSDDLTLSKRAPSLTISRLQKILIFSFSPILGHLRQVPRVATDPATTPVLRPLPLKTSDRSNNWIGGNLNMDIWGKVWVCFLYKTMYLSNSLRIFLSDFKVEHHKQKTRKE